MIAFAKHVGSKNVAKGWHERFVSILPMIRRHACMAFRDCDAELKDERVTEVIASCFVAYARLVELGKEDLAYPTALARFAVRQIRSGRRVGSKLNSQDVMSESVRIANRIRIERFSDFDHSAGGWRDCLIEDKKAGPAEIAAARIDLAAWFKSLSRRERKIAKALARGEATSIVAHMFGLTPGRVSQLRNWFMDSWNRFQGEN